MPKVAFCDPSRQAGFGGFGFLGFGGLFGVLSPMWHLLAGSIEPSKSFVQPAALGQVFPIFATSSSGSGAAGVDWVFAAA